MDLSTLNWLAVLVATLSTFVIGALWYGPIFGKIWMKEQGFTEEDLKNANMGKIYGTAFVLEFIMAFNLAMFIGPEAGVGTSIFYAFLAGFGWIAMAIGVNYLFNSRTLRLWFIDAFYFVICFVIMGAIYGLWK